MEILRFITAGSVDDGKSTLVGRLLYDSRCLYEDQLDNVRRNSPSGHTELAFITDGLRAEREQGITIDIAYRHFRTRRRRFIIADTPGHEQYTRNMATGASTADLMVILLDARKGVLSQTRRHAWIASLLGIRHFIVAVNKMDLTGYRQDVFDRIRSEFLAFSARLPRHEAWFVPISAINGDNVVSQSGSMPWYVGPTLLEQLETVPVYGLNTLAAFRFPVQYVVRADDSRGYCGQIAAGTVRPGDRVIALPSGREARVSRIATWDGDLDEAFAPMSVTLCLDDHLDVGRGTWLVDAAAKPESSTALRATLVWMAEAPLRPGQPFILKQMARTVCAEILSIESRLDIHTLQPVDAAELRMNDIGTVTLEAHQQVFFDAYSSSRSTGSLVLIDPQNNHTVAAGMISEGVVPNGKSMSKKGGLTVWFTGLSSAGKTTLSRLIYERLWAAGHKVEMLDGDVVRQHLSKGLGFTREDRDENIRRIGFLAHLLTRNGVIVLVSAISPYRSVRDEMRQKIGNFMEVYVNAPLEVCESRDVKGLYRRARAGQIPSFTGVNDPYEPPLNPELECRTDHETPAESVNKIVSRVEEYLSAL